MDFMEYPTFEFVKPERGWFPVINLPENYKELIPNFYKEGRKETIIKYAKLIEETLNNGNLEIRLRWDEKKGLRNINIGFAAGLDLTENFAHPHFLEHNLETQTSIATGMIAMKYISELLKSQ
jgi:hypothetical protein